MRKWALGSFLCAVVAAAQPAKIEIPRLYDGKPDLNGVWDIPYTNDMGRGVPGGLPFAPWERPTSRTTIPPNLITPATACRRV